jgi:hypothetical protein
MTGSMPSAEILCSEVLLRDLAQIFVHAGGIHRGVFSRIQLVLEQFLTG